MIEEAVSISLPSLVRRIGGEKTKHAKAIATQFDCELKRIRRSRNWQIIGTADAIIHFVEELKETEVDGFSYLIQKIDATLPSFGVIKESLEDKLAKLVIDNPNVTLTELMQQTSCSISQARRARFDADIL